MVRRALGLTLFVALAGCATHADRLKTARSAYYGGSTALAEAKLLEAEKDNASDAEVLRLERASIAMSAGRVDEAQTLLRGVRDRFTELEPADPLKIAKAALTDDQRLPYSGEDYEKVMVRAMLALTELLRDGPDAFAFAHQISQCQQDIIEKGGAVGDGKTNPKADYSRVALGAYICGAMREESPSGVDEARRSFKLVKEWQPNFSNAANDLARVENGVHCAKGHGVVYVVALVGRGPTKVEQAEPVSTIGLLLADRIISAIAPQTLPPNIAPVKIPAIQLPLDTISAVSVAVDGRSFGTTETVTDVNQLAVSQMLATRDYAIARAVSRRILKKGIVYAAKELTGTKKDSLQSLGIDVLGVAWEATESADTRCWGLLPSKIQVLRIELPAGDHQLMLRAAESQAGGESAKVRVEDGRNSWVLAHYPTQRLVGVIQTNSPVK